jgi:hypothetical protein
MLMVMVVRASNVTMEIQPGTTIEHGPVEIKTFPSAGDFLWGLLAGAIIGGFFIYTVTGRGLVRAGAAVGAREIQKRVAKYTPKK